MSDPASVVLLEAAGVLALLLATLVFLAERRQARRRRRRDELWRGRALRPGERRVPVLIRRASELRLSTGITNPPIVGVCSVLDRSVELSGEGPDGTTLVRSFALGAPARWVGAALLAPSSHEWIEIEGGDDPLLVAVDQRPTWRRRKQVTSLGLYRLLTGATPRGRTGWARLPGCAEGELLEREPMAPRELVKALVLAALGAPIAWWVVRWNRAQLDLLGQLAKDNPAVGGPDLIRHVTGMLGFLWLIAAAICASAIILAVRSLRAGRWPLPGARVDRLTSVVTGLCLRVRAGLIVLFCVGMIGYLSLNLVWLAGFFWDRQLDIATAHALKSVHRPERQR